MAEALTIEGLRIELGLTQEQFARRIGLSNKGSVSVIERGGPVSLPVALALETLSGGRIDAALLNTDVAMARNAIMHGAAASWQLDQRSNAAATAVGDDFDALDDALRIVVCDVCERRIDAPGERPCEFVDCPHSPDELAVAA